MTSPSASRVRVRRCGHPLYDRVQRFRLTEHDTFTEWLGNGFDPEAFDVTPVNEVLRMIR